MHFKFTTLTTVAVATLAAATGGCDSPVNQCDTGTILCCESLSDPNSASIAALLALLGVQVGTLSGCAGINCSPISVIGISGNSCSAQPVCCTGTSFSGVAALGCNSINLNL
ncbi:hypothetical protein D9619_012774 [Psilocybe cf. subviscida]|uniref:Hydrophobin n=1 Tax=Psilocybe cf. subviscida TaxID=2480587 RepID=A0A8H5AQX7_9AGAR|nr:hypothetical protein D9619_012774 [Psilocybe cf. subviscida]